MKIKLLVSSMMLVSASIYAQSSTPASNTQKPVNQTDIGGAVNQSQKPINTEVAISEYAVVIVGAIESNKPSAQASTPPSNIQKIANPSEISSGVNQSQKPTQTEASLIEYRAAIASAIESNKSNPQSSAMTTQANQHTPGVSSNVGSAPNATHITTPAVNQPSITGAPVLPKIK